MANKKKIATSAVAVATAAALALGGTFAWQSINQTALNEASDIVNPGGRLHNDMWYVSEKENNNDIYVENFAEDEIFARVRLGEFFEIVLNEGTAGEKLVPMIGEKELIQQTDENGDLVYGDDGNPVFTDEYKYTYVTFTGYDSKDKFDAGDNGDGTAYWTWKTGGQTTFMPTFNKNKDSLAPDLRGLYVDRIGGISNRANTQYTDAYGVMIDGVPTGDKEASAIYDYDSNMADELKDLDAVALTKLIDSADDAPSYDTNAVTLKSETHSPKATGTARLISMSDWLGMIPYNDETGEYEYNPNHWSDKENPGHAGYWVYDADGWVYWSAPIPAGEATGLLLDGIELKQVMDDTWYYAINVDAQFCTAGDMGTAPVYSDTETDEDGNPVLVTPGTGFYDTENGSVPSDDALTLLELIGVNDTTSDSTGDDTTGGSSIPEYTLDDSISITFMNYDEFDPKVEENQNGYIYFEGKTESEVATSVFYAVYDSKGVEFDSYDYYQSGANSAAVLTNVPSDTEVGDEFTAVFVYYDADGNAYGKSATVAWNGGSTETDSGEDQTTATYTLKRTDTSEVISEGEIGSGSINVHLSADDLDKTYTLTLNNFEGTINHFNPYGSAYDVSYDDATGTFTFSTASYTDARIMAYSSEDDTNQELDIHVYNLLGLKRDYDNTTKTNVNRVGNSTYYILPQGEMLFFVSGNYNNGNVTYSLSEETTDNVQIVEDEGNGYCRVQHLCESEEACSCSGSYYVVATADKDGMTETNETKVSCNPNGIYMAIVCEDLGGSCPYGNGDDAPFLNLSSPVSFRLEYYNGEDTGSVVNLTVNYEGEETWDSLGFGFEKDEQGYWNLTIPDNYAESEYFTKWDDGGGYISITVSGEVSGYDPVTVSEIKLYVSE